MLSGRTFAEICETSGDPDEVARWLRQWLHAGLITRWADD